MPEKLSVVIAVKDHLKYIKDCVRSVREITEEVLIADSGSSDGTVDLARVLCEGFCSCKVVSREFITATSFKNWALDQASHPWSLVLDVDEHITDELATEIRSLLDEGPCHDAYWIYRDNFFLGRRVRFGGWNHDRLLRLMKTDLVRYPDTTADHHDFPTNGLDIGQLKHCMIHYARCSYDEQFVKCQRYSRVQAEHLFQRGYRPSFLQMMFRPPLRFLRSYIAYGGFLDGILGLQIAYLAAYYAFMKQARLWELSINAQQPVEPENEQQSKAA